jgi:hypothetical protein
MRQLYRRMGGKPRTPARFATVHDFARCGRVNLERLLCQGTASQLAEKLIRAVGRGFIPGIKAHKIGEGFSP